MNTTNPLPYPEPVNDIPTRSLYAYHKWRIALHISSTILVVLGLILNIAGPATCRNSYYSDYYYYNDYCYWPIWALVALSVITVWNAVEFITLCVNKKGIHPGAHIALDFLICGGLFFVGLVNIFLSRRGVEIGAGALELTAAFIHLALWVFACIAVHDWRRARKGLTANAQVIVVPHQSMTDTPTAGPSHAPTATTTLPITMTAVPMATTSAHPYMSLPPPLPPPPPGMVYLVPAPQAMEVQQQQGAPAVMEYVASEGGCK